MGLRVAVPSASQLTLESTLLLLAPDQPLAEHTALASPAQPGLQHSVLAALGA